MYVVSDGMGGHNAGEVASLNAVEMVDKYFTPNRILEMRRDREKIRRELINAVLNAHEHIVRMGQKKEEYFGMGCTIAIAFIHNQELHTCHVGDSRVCIVNQAGIQQITHDHSAVSEMVEAGEMTREEARHSPLKNRLTQALGVYFPINPEYNEHPLNKGDKVLLYSDGLWDMLSDEEIYTIVLKDVPPENICQKLIEKANEAGGDDNVTVLLVKIGN